jgi:glycosyltransferase involved in cell wall biosynthesis
MVEVSFIIPSFNRHSSVNACIASILDSKLDNIEIIIVNDYKKSDILLDKINQSPLIKVVNNPMQGAASARNFGASLANSSRLIFVDDDMILNRLAITKAIDFLDTTLNSTFNADWAYEPKLLDGIKPTQFGRYLIEHNFTTLMGWNSASMIWKENFLLKAMGVTSQFLAIKKSDFDKVGGYNEDFPFAGFEDYDLYVKFTKFHIVNYIDTSVLIYHNESDRVTPLSWLNRQERGAKTRRIAVEMGFTELAIKYSARKKLRYLILSKFNGCFFGCLKLIPNMSIFDRIYFIFINALLGISIYKGFSTYVKPIEKI